MGASGLGGLLVKEGLLSQRDRMTITRTCGQGAHAFAKTVIAMGLLDEDELASFLAARTQFAVAPKNMLEDMELDALKGIDAALLGLLEVIPLKVEGNALTVAMADPLDRDVVRQLEFFTGYRVKPLIAPFSKIREGLGKLLEAFTPAHTHFEDFLGNHALSALRKLQGEGKLNVSAAPSPGRAVAGAAAGARTDRVAAVDGGDEDFAFGDAAGGDEADEFLATAPEDEQAIAEAEDNAGAASRMEADVDMLLGNGDAADDDDLLAPQSDDAMMGLDVGTSKPGPLDGDAGLDGDDDLLAMADAPAAAAAVAAGLAPTGGEAGDDIDGLLGDGGEDPLALGGDADALGSGDDASAMDAVGDDADALAMEDDTSAMDAASDDATAGNDDEEATAGFGADDAAVASDVGAEDAWSASGDAGTEDDLAAAGDVGAEDDFASAGIAGAEGDLGVAGDAGAEDALEAACDAATLGENDASEIPTNVGDDLTVGLVTAEDPLAAMGDDDAMGDVSASVTRAGFDENERAQATGPDEDALSAAEELGGGEALAAVDTDGLDRAADDAFAALSDDALTADAFADDALGEGGGDDVPAARDGDSRISMDDPLAAMNDEVLSGDFGASDALAEVSGHDAATADGSHTENDPFAGSAAATADFDAMPDDFGAEAPLAAGDDDALTADAAWDDRSASPDLNAAAFPDATMASDQDLTALADDVGVDGSSPELLDITGQAQGSPAQHHGHDVLLGGGTGWGAAEAASAAFNRALVRLTLARDPSAARAIMAEALRDGFPAGRLFLSEGGQWQADETWGSRADQGLIAAVPAPEGEANRLRALASPSGPDLCGAIVAGPRGPLLAFVVRCPSDLTRNDDFQSMFTQCAAAAGRVAGVA